MKGLKKGSNSFKKLFKLSRYTWLNNKLERWLTVRIPVAEQHILSNRNIFIMPTKFGLSFLFAIFLLFLLATNYQNNIIMLMSYLLASVFITSMMTSFFNLSGLKIKVAKQSQGNAGQSLWYAAELTSKINRYNLHFNFPQQAVVKIVCCEQGISHLQLPFVNEQRGRFLTGRLKISSEYCFGLFITWTQLDFASQAIVFPQAKAIKQSLLSSIKSESLEQFSTINQNFSSGYDDFYQLKPYVQGEPLSRIAWKQFAQGKGYLSKEYQQNQGSACWLNIDDMPSNNLETKLQMLAYLIRQYSEQGQIFGLKLNVETIAPNASIDHTMQCLIALADQPSVADTTTNVKKQIKAVR